jgi:hypothetical protein
MKNYSLTKEQIKAVKSVERAMRKASKIGVHFWDDYGSLRAYNNNKIYLPVPDINGTIELNYDFVEKVNVDNFHSGNADDPLYIEFR